MLKSLVQVRCLRSQQTVSFMGWIVLVSGFTCANNKSVQFKCMTAWLKLKVSMSRLLSVNISLITTLRSQIEGYTQLLIFIKIFILLAGIWAGALQYQRLIIFKKISSLFFHLHTWFFFPSFSLFLEPTRLSNLDKNWKQPFY